MPSICWLLYDLKAVDRDSASGLLHRELHSPADCEIRGSGTQEFPEGHGEIVAGFFRVAELDQGVTLIVVEGRP